MSVAVITGYVCTTTPVVFITNVALVCPGATVTVDGGIAEASELESTTGEPFGLAGPLSVMVPTV